MGAGGREGGGVDEAVVSGMTLTVVSEASSNKSRAFFALPITLSPPNKQMSYSLKYFDEKRERNRRIKGGRKKDIQLRKSSEAEDRGRGQTAIFKLKAVERRRRDVRGRSPGEVA